ncbi:hypothetical protein M900_0886 [Bacteriovorax sp. Seq25_V]|nr:hypothetical protein M900_0886 [Bacteriovorax sp. Seq25_V]
MRQKILLNISIILLLSTLSLKCCAEDKAPYKFILTKNTTMAEPSFMYLNKKTKIWETSLFECTFDPWAAGSIASIDCWGPDSIRFQSTLDCSIHTKSKPLTFFVGKVGVLYQHQNFKIWCEK